MGTAKKEIPVRPDLLVGKPFAQVGDGLCPVARFNVQHALLHMNARRCDRFAQALTKTKVVYQDLQDRTANAVGTAAAQGQHPAIFPTDQCRRHHGGDTAVGLPLEKAIGVQVFLSQHVVQHDTSRPKNMAATFAV